MALNKNCFRNLTAVPHYSIIGASVAKSRTFTVEGRGKSRICIGSQADPFGATWKTSNLHQICLILAQLECRLDISYECFCKQQKASCHKEDLLMKVFSHSCGGISTSSKLKAAGLSFWCWYFTTSLRNFLMRMWHRVPWHLTLCWWPLRRIAQHLYDLIEIRLVLPYHV